MVSSAARSSGRSRSANNRFAIRSRARSMATRSPTPTASRSPRSRRGPTFRPRCASRRRASARAGCATACARPPRALPSDERALMSATLDGGAADAGAAGAVGRYQIVVIGKEGAVLLDTATGSSWSLARDIDTLQLGWRPLDGRWPSAVLDHAAGRALPHPHALPGEAALTPVDADGASAAWWRPRHGSRWSRAKPPKF